MTSSSENLVGPAARAKAALTRARAFHNTAELALHQERDVSQTVSRVSEMSSVSSAWSDDTPQPKIVRGLRTIASNVSDHFPVWLSSGSRSQSFMDRFENFPPIAQTASFTSLALFLIWCLAASIMVLLAAEVYKHGAVNYTRERYAASAADRVAADAAGLLSSAYAVHDALSYAIRRNLYVEPLDYSAVRRALEPVFITSQSLWAVDVGFVGQNTSLTMRRRLGNLSALTMIVQSDAPDCFDVLGHVNCISRDAVPAQEQPWFKLGLDLPGGQEIDEDYSVSAITDANMAFQWVDGPSFVSLDPNVTSAFGDGAVGQASKHVPWEPAQALVFRVLFPGTGGVLSLIGRATLKLTALRSDNRMTDAQLGPQGALFVCDRGGTLLAAAHPGLQAMIQRPTGRIRFRRAWELGFDWAKELGEKHFRGGRHQFNADGFHVSIAPLRGRGLGHFFALVAAEKDKFEDEAYYSRSIAAEIMIALPYPVALVILLVYFGYRRHKRNRSLRRVQPA